MVSFGRLLARKCFERSQQLFIAPATRRLASNDTTTKAKGVADSGEKIIPTPNGEAILPLWRRLGPVTEAFQTYGRSQSQRPYATQVATSIVIYCCGDLSAQRIGGEAYDPKRTARNILTGAICSIPAYNWFMYLGRSFNYASKTLSLGTKVVVNQIVFTPVFNSYFFGMQALLAGNGMAEVWEHIKRTVPTSFINSWKLWPAVTAFNFTYIQPQYRAVFAGFVAIGWQSYLSWLNQRVVTARNSKNDSDKLESTATV